MLVSIDVTFFKSKCRFNSGPFSLESKDDNIFVLIQDLSVVHTPSSVDINLNTLSFVHVEPVLPKRFGELTRVFTRHTSATPRPASSVISIFRTQTGENTSTLSSSDTTDSNCVSDDLHICSS